MTFGDALEAIKKGAFVARAGWNGKGMYLYMQGYSIGNQNQTLQPCIVMHTADAKEQPGWAPSQPDMFADDWSVVTPAVAPVAP